MSIFDSVLWAIAVNMAEHKPLPGRAFGENSDIDPLTGQHTPGTESRRTYGQQDKKPKEPETPHDPYEHWQSC